MVEQELDMTSNYIKDSDETVGIEATRTVVEGPQTCCHCYKSFGMEDQVFDMDNCAHSICVNCRFHKCLLCDEGSRTQETKSTDTFDLVYIKSSLKKKFNTDHIVDVEVTTTEGVSQKQMCTVCKRIFKKTNARYHYSCATGDKPFACIECGQKFVKKSHMESHLNSHYGIKPFKCPVAKCKSSFTQKDKLTRHMQTHDKGVKYECHVCKKWYTSEPILAMHLQKVHSMIKPFQCDLCPRSYKYKRSLRIHRLKHQAIREYMCEVCGKKYPVSTLLKHHKRSHIMYHRRPFKCKCGRRFMTRHDKARHELIHAF